MLKKGSDLLSVNPRAEPTEKFNDEIQAKIGGTVWTGCLSYYVCITYPHRYHLILPMPCPSDFWPLTSQIPFSSLHHRRINKEVRTWRCTLVSSPHFGERCELPYGRTMILFVPSLNQELLPMGVLRAYSKQRLRLARSVGNPWRRGRHRKPHRRVPL